MTEQPRKRASRPKITTHYEVGPADECWPWLGTIEAAGYGVLYRDGKFKKGHRYVWELLVGPITPGLVLDHICHNKACVNPGHLRMVTQKQNIEHLRGANSNSASGIRNVHPTADGKWAVTIRHHRKAIYIGRFADIGEAEAAAIAARAQYFTHAD